MAPPDELGDDRFDVSPSADSAAESSEHEGANVCRVAALSTMLGNDREGIRLLAPELEQLGFSAVLRSSDRDRGDVGVVAMFADLRQQDAPQERGRVWRWQMIGETMSPQAAVAFLVDVLGSQLERECVAAAAALWRQIGLVGAPGLWSGPQWWHAWGRLFDLWGPGWTGADWWGLPWEGVAAPTADDADGAVELPWDPERWSAIYQRTMSRIGDPYSNVLLVRMLCGWCLSRGLRSPDPITRSLATAAFPPAPDDEPVTAPPSAPGVTLPGALVVSTMIHGTWGWKGSWWRPRSDFHEFILRNHRSNLYSRGAKFSWSGAYRKSHRRQAAIDFGEWAHDVAPQGLQSLFAHSYGGEVAARAVLDGARVDELILLSAPVTTYVEAAAGSGVRVVDVRLRFDPVLGLARTRQRLRPRPNVTEVLLGAWRYDHGASHREDVWRDEDVAPRGGI